MVVYWAFIVVVKTIQNKTVKILGKFISAAKLGKDS
jgi:hypothetical protein